eukprot:1488468-Rhodomonas_salina.1
MGHDDPEDDKAANTATEDTAVAAKGTPKKKSAGAKRRSQMQRLKARLAQADRANGASVPGPTGGKPTAPKGDGRKPGTRAEGVPGCIGCEKSRLGRCLEHEIEHKERWIAEQKVKLKQYKAERQQRKETAAALRAKDLESE